MFLEPQLEAVMENNTGIEFLPCRSVMTESSFRGPAMPHRTGWTVTDQSE